MAQPEAYRDGTQCSRCGANRLPKYGHSRGRQTCRCGQCRYHFVPGTGRPHQPEQLKAQAVALYAAASSPAAGSRPLGIPEAGRNRLFLA